MNYTLTLIILQVWSHVFYQRFSALKIQVKYNFETIKAYGGELKKFLLAKESLSRHRQRQKIFKRRKIFSSAPYVGLQADTINYRNYSRFNSGYGYILGGLKIIQFLY